MKINCDWSGYNYIKLGGFDEHLRNIGENENEYLKFFQFDYGEKIELYSNNSDKIDQEIEIFLSKNRRKWQNIDVWDFFDIREQYLTEISNCNLFLSHTFPLAVGIKPFIFLYKNLESLFLPIFNRNETFDYQKYLDHPLKIYLADVLEDHLCMGIIVSSEQEREILKTFFSNEIITNKIHISEFIESNLDQSIITKYSNIRDKSLTFLYLGSLKSYLPDEFYIKTYDEFCSRWLEFRKFDKFISINSPEIFNSKIFQIANAYNPDLYEPILTRAHFVFFPKTDRDGLLDLDLYRNGLVQIKPTIDETMNKLKANSTSYHHNTIFIDSKSFEFSNDLDQLATQYAELIFSRLKEAIEDDNIDIEKKYFRPPALTDTIAVIIGDKKFRDTNLYTSTLSDLLDIGDYVKSAIVDRVDYSRLKSFVFFQRIFSSYIYTNGVEYVVTDSSNYHSFPSLKDIKSRPILVFRDYRLLIDCIFKMNRNKFFTYEEAPIQEKKSMKFGFRKIRRETIRFLKKFTNIRKVGRSATHR